MSATTQDRCECGRILAQNARSEECEHCRGVDQTTSVSGISMETGRRFRSTRDEAQERIGEGYLYNDEFVNLLLDVYEHHLDSDEGGEL